MKIIVCGDIHGEWAHLNKLINRKNPDIILQCGDWGWWPSFHDTTMIFNGYTTQKFVGDHGSLHEYKAYKPWSQTAIKNWKTKIYWCDGNHENHWDLKEKQYIEAPCEVQKNIFYMKRGSTLTLPDGRVVLFMGGADSIDKNSRKLGFDWFPEETITQKDIMSLPDIKIDIVVSHTCPFEFKYDLFDKAKESLVDDKFNDPSCKALDYILERYKPSLWYFGHFHFYKKGKYDNTEWYCLSMPTITKWWQWLE